MSPSTFFRKLHWKLRWKVTAKPMVIRSWHNGMCISLPLSGSAAQVYYRKYSEPLVEHWMRNHLREGDCFVDIGAHIGEYSLIAAASVGAAGKIIALEPQADLCSTIRRNFSDNGIRNFQVIHGALGDHNGTCHLFTDGKSKGAVLDMESKSTDVPMLDLPTLLEEAPESGAVWIKMDAAGYELPCLMAGEESLRRRPIHLILKAYSPQEVSNRFPAITTSLHPFLTGLGYRCQKFREGIPVAWDGSIDGYCEVILCTPPGFGDDPAEMKR